MGRKFSTYSCQAFLAVSALLLIVLCGREGVVHGAVSEMGNLPCIDCHTMHNSQNRSTMLLVGDTTLNPSLLRTECTGCHQGTKGASPVNSFNAPIVLYTADPGLPPADEGPGYMTAGGNFYWVADAGGNDDAKGHNVSGVSGGDAALAAPPGFGSGEAAPGGTTPGTVWASNQLGCAGTYGCHGTHDTTDQYAALNKAHHNNTILDTTAAQPASGAVPGESYRFLQGIKGVEDEDGDWEWTATDGTNDHNQYFGVHGGGNSQTISSLCAQCHGNYHGTTAAETGGASAWIRHPTDFDLGATDAGSEYRSYNGGPQAAAPYSVVVPVGSNSLASVLATVNIGSINQQGVVTCLSCHRAHGSPYYKMMRWDYAASATGGDCAVCHTSKN